MTVTVTGGGPLNLTRKFRGRTWAAGPGDPESEGSKSLTGMFPSHWQVKIQSSEFEQRLVTRTEHHDPQNTTYGGNTLIMNRVHNTLKAALSVSSRLSAGARRQDPSHRAGGPGNFAAHQQARTRTSVPGRVPRRMP